MSSLNKQVQSFTKSIEDKAKGFYTKYPSIKQFKNPKFEDSEVQERIMRLGVETKTTHAYTNDELYVLACATLHEDYMKHGTKRWIQSKDWIQTKDFKSLFEVQTELGGNYLYMSLNEKDVLQVFSSPTLSDIQARFKYGSLKAGSMIPVLE